MILALAYLIFNGSSYYSTGIEKRFFHQDYNNLKPSGLLGHGFGIIGSVFMIIGILIYMIRKRARSLSRVGLLKHWLEFHIFLCTLGPILILFHTTFKFGGIVSVSFWSMVLVFLSGIIGRFIYIQIPRSIEGRELSLQEVKGLKTELNDVLSGTNNLNEESLKIIIESTKKKIELFHKNIIIRYLNQSKTDRKNLKSVKSVIKNNQLSKTERTRILSLVKSEISLNRQIERLDTMKNIFKYWHVAHLPFAIVMLTIMVIHVIVTIVFGYKWIF